MRWLLLGIFTLYNYNWRIESNEIINSYSLWIHTYIMAITNPTIFPLSSSATYVNLEDMRKMYIESILYEYV